MRYAPIFLLCISSNLFAYPTTYNFAGRVTDFHYSGSTFNPAAGDAINGTFTYDSTYTGTLYGQPLPATAILLDWRISIDGESYQQQFISPLIQTIICCNSNSISFFDEMPGKSSAAAFFDQGGFGLLLSELGVGTPSELPVSSFLTGWFSLGGGNGTGNSGASLNGVIDAIEAQVPEPNPAPLAFIGLVGTYLVHRGKKTKAAANIFLKF